MNIAIVGVKSIGRHTVPVICRTTFECPGSSLITVATFVTFPPKPVELNCNGIEPVLPGSTVLSHVPAVVKALSESRLNAHALGPRTVCVGVPPVSGEQRADLAKHVKRLGEEAKVAVRAIRQDARKEIAARGRGSERAVQEATDAAVAEVERLVKAKTKELGA